MKKKVIAACTGLAIGVMGLAGCGGTDTAEQSGQTTEFVPQLDTEREVELQVAGFFGNFEALEQVENNFNEYYPNVTFSYEQNGDKMLKEYLQNNEYVDIFMTTDNNVSFPEQKEWYVGEDCLDFSQAGIDCSAIREDVLESGTVDGVLMRVPMGQKLYGMVVNKTLLEKEGQKIPENYQEFCDVCEALKEKGYTPVQGAVPYVYADMMANMAMVTIGTDEELTDRFNNREEGAAEALQPVFEKLEDIIARGYTDYAVNSTYPEDNYDGAILTFFDGKVPFWICDSEKASGMKKRESKSENYTADPFEYQFMYVPLGENGAYAYVEPWYGFSVNKNSDELDYAVEFMRFLTREDQMNQLASIKGVPAVTKNTDDEKYVAIGQQKIEKEYRYDGKLYSYFKNFIDSANTKLGSGECADAAEAVKLVEQELED